MHAISLGDLVCLLSTGPGQDRQKFCSAKMKMVEQFVVVRTGDFLMCVRADSRDHGHTFLGHVIVSMRLGSEM